MQREYTIFIDDREKKPLAFPQHLVLLDPGFPPHARVLKTVRLTTIRTRIPTGDYILAGNSGGGGAVVERKSGVREIAGNCLVPARRKRFVAELERMQSWHRRILLLEGSFNSLADPEYHGASDALIRLLREYAVELHVAPTGSHTQKLAAGEWVARLLINEELVPPPMVPNRPGVTP
jgi:ERCC4-type nuclease